MTVGAQLSRVIRLRRQTIMILSQTDPEPARDPSLTVVQATFESLDDTTQYAPSPASLLQLRGFLESGRMGVQAYLNGVPSGHAWATTSASTPVVVNGYFRLPPHSALIHHCRVAEGHRGRGIYGAMLRHLSKVALASGAERVLLDADTANTPSISGAGRAGFRVIGYGIYLQIAGTTVLRRQPL